MVIMFYAIEAAAPLCFPFIRKCFSDFMSLAAETDVLAVDDLQAIFLNSVIPFAVTCAPLLLLSCFLGVMISGIQTKFIFNTKTLNFKMSRLNPLQGLKKMFSLRGLVELLKVLFLLVWP